MKIAFLHYHLKRGGVTSVLKQQATAVKNADGEVFMLVGESPPSESFFPFDVAHISGLGYDDKIHSNVEIEAIAKSIIKAISSKWKNGCDVLHVHNPTLAKNINFLKILKALQQHGIKFFLQIHDFAEDGRPLSYFHDDEYPADCHYGVINSRDYDILLKSGIKKDGLHKIFNTITSIECKDTLLKNFVLYPVRAIRRKNIGEAILLSLFFKNNEALAITLPPNSSTDINSYKGWKKFTSEKNLNVEFEAGLKNDFAKLVLSAKFILTTSISEGFGFSFLEPWTAKKLLLGRKIPDICCDFEQKNIKLNHLYEKLFVPIEWIGKEKFYKKWKECVLKNSALFNYAITKENIMKSFAKTISNNKIDFGLLDETFQKQVICCVLSDKKKLDKLVNLNPCLTLMENISNKEKIIQGNLAVITKHYNQKKYQETLLDIYSKIVKTPVRHSINKKVLLSQFFQLDNFNLLKWSDYA